MKKSCNCTRVKNVAELQEAIKAQRENIRFTFMFKVKLIAKYFKFQFRNTIKFLNEVIFDKKTF